MRKSKVIVPAIALLTLSMSAAITSTVAWFTYVRDVTLTGDQLTAINSNGDLKVAVTKTVGCTQGGTEKAPKISFGKFRDGSVDLANVGAGTEHALAYFPQIVQDKETVSHFVAINSTHEYKERDVYLANLFSLEFSISRSDESRHLLFFDAETSKSKTEAIMNNGSSTVKQALRFGFKITSSTDENRNDKWFVWAPFTTLVASTDNAHFIGQPAGTPLSTDFAKRDYAEGDIADETALEPTYLDEPSESEAKARNNYLGYFESGKGKGNSEFETDSQKINVDVYVWFEGTDPICDTKNIVEEDPKWQVALEFSTKYGQLTTGYDTPTGE